MNKNNKTSTKNAIMSGKNIYKDKHGNTIYYHEKSNTVYRIAPSKENMFSTYQSRYVLSAIAFVLFYILFQFNIYFSIGACILIAAFLEYKYRNFLKKCPQSKGFIKQEKIKPIDQMIEIQTGGLVIRAVLYGALAILLIVNTFVSENVNGNIPLEVTSFVIAIFAAYIAYKYITLIIRKKSGN